MDSYQMTNSGKQQRCFFFLSANKNKKTKKKHKATQRRKQERANRPGRHARRVPPMIPQRVCSISDARHVVSLGHFRERLRTGPRIKKNGRNKGRINMPNRPTGTEEGTFLMEGEHNIPQAWKKQLPAHCRGRGGWLSNPGPTVILHSGGALSERTGTGEEEGPRPGGTVRQKDPFQARQLGEKRVGCRKILFRQSEGGGQRRPFFTVPHL